MPSLQSSVSTWKKSCAAEYFGEKLSRFWRKESSKIFSFYYKCILLSLFINLMYSFSIKLNFFKEILLTPHFWTVVFYPDMRNRLFIYFCLCCLCIYTFIRIKGALSVFYQTMLIFESTKTNTPIAQQDPPLFWYLRPTRTYTTLALRWSRKQAKTQAYSNKSRHR